LEEDFDAEQRRGKEAQAQARKFERQYKEIIQQADDDRKMVVELQDLLDKTQIKLKNYKRQLEETEEVAQITLTKYRKAQQMIDEAESRADTAERTLTIRRGSSVAIRSVSVSREMSSRSHMGRATSIM
jgi:chromosome segregation ATPase